MRSIYQQLGDIISLGVTIASAYYIYNALTSMEDPEGSGKKSKEIISQLGHKIPEEVLKTLDHHEIQMLQHVVYPPEINVGFDDIGGLDEIRDDLKETVIFPLLNTSLMSQSSLLEPPKGVLLYGPPGCGKTTIAKALAKESGANFINIAPSSLNDKFFGETNKRVAALFTLAEKLSPCIVFVDEIDCLMRNRDQNDHEASLGLKTEFMSRWDGLLTSHNGVLILGATNRKNDIDAAFLRRMPKQYAIKKPNANERRKILEIILQKTKLESGFEWDVIVNDTEGLSGSDLKEYCRNAAMRVMREMRRSGAQSMRGLRSSDFMDLVD